MKKAVKQSTLILALNGISVGLLLCIAILFCFVISITGSIAQANTDRFDLTYNANRFMNGSSYLTNEVRAYAATGDTARYDNYWNEINTLKNRDIGVENMKAIGITDAEQALIEAMSALSNKLVPLESQAMEDVASGHMDTAIGYVYGTEYNTSIGKINELKSNFLTDLDRRAKGEVERLMALSQVTEVIVFVLIVMASAMQILTSALMRKKVIKPMVQVQLDMIEMAEGKLSAAFHLEPDSSEIGMLVGAMLKLKTQLQEYIKDISYRLNEMAKGNLDITVDSYYSNDFWPIKIAMNKILDSLNTALTRIHQTSDLVASRAEQVSSGAQALAQGATEQASSVEELSATMLEISAQISQAAQGADSARNCSVEASGQLALGNHKMEALTGAMSDISDASSQIGTIIKTIEDISFQTNILALNAAVEAARAGVAGKGFAVVADEVRSLANKSAVAAKDTTALIENSLKLVERGSLLVKETSATLQLVVVGAKQSTAFVERIAESTGQQSAALQQVSHGIEQISSVVQTNAATAQQSAAASEELDSQSILLKDAIGQFLLRSTLK